MGIIKRLICEDCKEESMFDIETPLDIDYDYSEIINTGEPSYEEYKNWTVKAKQCPDDPIAICFEHYCPNCKLKFE